MLLISITLLSFLWHFRLFSCLVSFVSFYRFSDNLDSLSLLSVLSCRSKSSLPRCAQKSTPTWRRLCRATKRRSSNAWRSSAWTSRWVKALVWRRGSCESSHWSKKWLSAGGGGCPSSAFIIALWPLKDSGGALKISPRSVAQIWPSLTHPAGQCVIWVGVQFFLFPKVKNCP